MNPSKPLVDQKKVSPDAAAQGPLKGGYKIDVVGRLQWIEDAMKMIKSARSSYEAQNRKS